MPRPREFDEEEVLTRALDVFWTHGYDATSVTDLMEATGLAKGSLYKGFGDKRRLFMLALETYLTEGSAALRACAASCKTGRGGLEQILSSVVGLSTCSGVRRGCFAVNSAIELGPHDPDVRNVLRRSTRHREKILAGLVERGAVDGSLRKGLDAEAVARSLTTLMSGLQVQGKLGRTKEQARETVAMAFEAWV